MAIAARTMPALVAVALAVLSPVHAQQASKARALVSVTAPAHDPLFIDSGSVERRGDRVSFKYVLDVRAPPDEQGQPGAWRSNEIDATLDCVKRTVSIRRLTAFPGPRASGGATLVHALTGADVKPQKIAPNSTFAHLEAHLCRGSK